MEANENLKLVGDQSDIPKDYELLEIEDITKLSESDYDELRSLVRKAIKDGTIRLTRNAEFDKNKDKEDAVKFVSEGGAGDHRKSRMGSYIKTSQRIRECPVFEQVEKQESEKQHYLFVGRDGCWRVGPDVTSYSGSVLKHPKKNAEKPPKIGWLYYLDNKWNKDDSLQLIKKQDVPQAKAHIQKKISNNCDCAIVEEFENISKEGNISMFKNITCLGIAILKDETAAVETSLKKGCDINCDKIMVPYDHDDDHDNSHFAASPLVLACQFSSLPVISLLVKHPGIDIDKRTDDGETALAIAARKPENLEMVKLLVESGAKVYLRDGEGYNPLHRAVRAGDVEMVKYLHSKGAKLYLNGTGILLLWRAVDEENLPMVRYLVENGASLDSPKVQFGVFSPFETAVWNISPEIVKYMIEQGADVTTKPNFRGIYNECRCDTLLDIAHYVMKDRYREGSNEYKENKPKYDALIPMLKAAESNSKHDGVIKTCDCSIVEEFQVSEKVTYKNLPCLGIAVLQNDIKAVESSLRKGCNVNFDKIERKECSYQGMTPVMLASDLEMVKILVEAGADPDNKTIAVRKRKNGLSLLHLAADAGQLDILKYLQSKGVYMDTNAESLGTPLWLASYHGNLEIVKYLANQGVGLDVPIDRYNPYKKDHSNFPLNVAVEEGHVDVVKFLIKQGADVDKECERLSQVWGQRGYIRYSNLELAQAKLDDPGTADKDKPIYEEIICILKEGEAKEPDGGVIKNLVLETLDVIKWIWAEKIQYYSEQFPYCIKKLQELTKKQGVWLTMLEALMEDVSVQNPIGPVAMALLINHTSPYPPNFVSDIQEIQEIPEMLKILEIASSYDVDDIRHVNTSIILSSFAQYIQRKLDYNVYNRIKMAKIIMTPATLDYLFGNLKPGSNPEATVFSLLALEFLTNEKENGNISWKYGACGYLTWKNQNAEIVRNRFREYGPDDHPLIRIEKLVVSDDFAEKQAGFCAQWYLDNLWPDDTERELSMTKGYPIHNPNARSQQIIDNTNAHWIDNVKLIPLYRSKYLKVGSNGLEVRGDGPCFETAMSTVQVDEGVWYYEVTIVTGGPMQIGWGTKKCQFLKENGYGVGDDKFSQSYDGCRQVVWYNRLQSDGDKPHGWAPEGQGPISSWKPGDVIGSLIDIENEEFMFSLNGVNIRAEPYKDVFEKVKDGFFVAISLMSFQQCQVNFGKDPFKHPPEERIWKPLNEAGVKALEGMLGRCHKMTRKGSNPCDSYTITIEDLVYVVLIGKNLFFYKDPKSYSEARESHEAKELVELEGAGAEVKKYKMSPIKNAKEEPWHEERHFTLSLANGEEILFEAHDNDEMKRWVEAINNVANYEAVEEF